ncbi:hypothetical protein LUW76_07785 [Actinomadura madurae]|uniref:hypothetical protein n=1 Tax=Actinomadura madurae TaxID=1993 RepID=UPI0020263C87|nr:hypothetical protein [Actinomadura madurae]URM94238.1 hypothetical protein LUW76_07785 [Actinomadura madurae]URN04943.1 hypothetical protein LUW74_17540 [Actinomadura madurae]
MSTVRMNCGNHGPVDRVPTHLSLGTRLRRWLQRSGGAFRAVHHPGAFHIVVPAKGDGYTFSVTVHFTWCVTGHEYPEVLAARTEEHQFIVKERLATQVRAVSRDFAPYEAGEAEKHFDQVAATLFADTRLEFLSGDQTDGEAHPIDHRTIVALDKPVRDVQREAWIKRQNAANEHELARRLVMYFGDRRLLWQQFLKSGQSEWLTPYAVALAEDPDAVAEVVERMAKDRRVEAKELADHVADQVRQYEARDAFDLMMQNDLVLRHLMELIGVPGIPPPAPPPFDGPGASR